jgi:arabinose-5-phosphate isomerase
MTSSSPPDSLSADILSALRTLSTEQQGLVQLSEALTNGLGAPFTAAIETLFQLQGRVIVTGMGKSGHIARKIVATFASTGTPAYFVHPAEASHGDLGMIKEGDVILALSWSGETAELADLVAYAKRFRVTLIGVTSNADSALGQAADIALVLPRAAEACPNGLAPTTSTTMQLVMGDALAVALLEKRGFSAQDFRDYHPGGKLGARLKQVKDIMHQGDRLPLMPLGSKMAEALIVQSEKGFGCVIVVDDQTCVKGIITDGDLRRHMGHDLLTKNVEDIMTPAPLTIKPSLLLSEALELVESRKRSTLIVALEGRVTGLVHVLDLLRAGIV